LSSKPFGEARRLRYIFYICEKLLRKKEIEKDSFIEMLLNDIDLINSNLYDYKRKTGIMRTRAVTRNYISYCKWMKVLKIESDFIISNHVTVYLSEISNNDKFQLNTKEKISIMILLLNNEFFTKFLYKLKNRSTPKDYINTFYSEHYIETFLEWLIDLDVLIGSSKIYGDFRATINFHDFPLFLKNNMGIDQILVKYVSLLLNKKIQIYNSFNTEIMWAGAMAALYKTMKFTRSEMDSDLFSAYPMIMNLQTDLILEYGAYIPLKQLISILKEISKNKNVIFEWDYSSNNGYIKLSD
jgi:hypothetical protein